MLGFLGSAFGGLLNMFSGLSTNAENSEINQNNLDYNSAMTREQWERDDNAHQREVADLKAAGLSPIANLNGAQSSSPLGAPSPIGMVAPQFDTNSLVQSILGSQELEEKKREFNIKSGHKDTELEQNAQKIQLEARSLDLQDKKLNNEFQIANDINVLRSKEIENFSRELEEIKRHNKEEERRKEEARLYDEYIERTKRIYEDAQKNCPEFVGGIEWCFSVDELESAQQSYNTNLDSLIKELGSLKNADGSFSTELSPHLGNKLIGGVDGSIGADVNQDNSDKRRAIIEKYKGRLKMPRLVSKEDRDMFDDNRNLKYSR